MPGSPALTALVALRHQRKHALVGQEESVDQDGDQRDSHQLVDAVGGDDLRQHSGDHRHAWDEHGDIDEAPQEYQDQCVVDENPGAASLTSLTSTLYTLTSTSSLTLPATPSTTSRHLSTFPSSTNFSTPSIVAKSHPVIARHCVLPNSLRIHFDRL